MGQFDKISTQQPPQPTAECLLQVHSAFLSPIRLCRHMQAYRDWDVKLYDWQSQCSMFADAEGMKYTLRRLMPTVGCEADAIAFTEEAQEMFSASAAPAISPDGGYTHAPAGLERKDVHKATAEHTFPLSTGQRVRMVHVLKRMGRDQNWRLMNVEVHRERYNDAYNGRRELAGCGGGMDPFATSPALDVGVLEGGWIAEGLRFGPNGAVEAVNGEPWSFEALKNVIGLPLGTWSAGVVVGEDADLAAGVVLDDGRVKVARQVTKGGTLATAELLTLRKAA